MSQAGPEPFVQALSMSFDPVRCCEQLAGLPHLLFLDSAARGGPYGRFSFVMADPFAIVRTRAGVTECIDTATGTARVTTGDALASIREVLRPHRVDANPDLPPFVGGAAGYLAYEWAQHVERVPRARHDDLALDVAFFCLYDWALAWDHERGNAWMVSTGMPETAAVARDRRAAARATALLARLRGEPAADPPSAPPTPGLRLRSSFTAEAYRRAVERVRDHILAGDIYQANLSQRFDAPLHESAWSFYQRLRAVNPAPFAAYFDLGDTAIMSASPERFLKLDERGRVETRPIKGTRPRNADPARDAALREELRSSVKDRAENVMIVDVMRNDLSRVCVPGTVRVPELFGLETHGAVHHLVSTVVGHLMPGADAADLLRATFPGGSITGAPKLRAMEIIADIEPVTRGVYCGALGYWSLTGALDMNIPIRTAVARNGHVYFSAGGGIVADSNPEDEYAETLDKARGLIRTLSPRS